MNTDQDLAFIFPGQGAQYVGMAKDFVENFTTARRTFEEAEDLLKISLLKLVSEGPLKTLTETKNSQVAIFTSSLAIFRVFQEQFAEKAKVCAGLSLGEYTALVAAEKISFASALQLVSARANYMNLSCETSDGAMAVVMGLSDIEVESVVQQSLFAGTLFVANYNCPGQIVISGAKESVAKAIDMLKACGAKRALPLEVHGAFHSGYMKEAEKKLSPEIALTNFAEGISEIIMNFSGDFAKTPEILKKNLICQVSGSVRWQQSMHCLKNCWPDITCIEFGPGKTLAGLNRRMDIETVSIDKIADLKNWSERS